MAQEEELLRLQMQAHLVEAIVMACTADAVPGALADLASLVNQGQLTQEEFRVAKQQVLSGPPLRDALFTQVARFQEWEDRRGGLAPTINPIKLAQPRLAAPLQGQGQEEPHHTNRSDIIGVDGGGGTVVGGGTSAHSSSSSSSSYGSGADNNGGNGSGGDGGGSGEISNATGSKVQFAAQSLKSILGTLKDSQSEHGSGKSRPVNGERVRRLTHLTVGGERVGTASSGNNLRDSKASAVARWLDTIELSLYAAKFEQHGYERMDDLTGLHAEALTDLLQKIMMKGGHEQRFRKHLNLIGADHNNNGSVSAVPTPEPTLSARDNRRIESVSNESTEVIEVDRSQISRNTNGEEEPHSSDPELWNIDGTELDMNQEYKAGGQMWYLWSRATDNIKAGRPIPGVPINERARKTNRRFSPPPDEETELQLRNVHDENTELLSAVTTKDERTSMDRLQAAKRSIYMSQVLLLVSTMILSFVLIVCPPFLLGKLYGSTAEMDGLLVLAPCELPFQATCLFCFFFYLCVAGYYSKGGC